MVVKPIDLKSVSQHPKYCCVGLPGADIEALYTIDFLRHILLMGQSDFVLQLQGMELLFGLQLRTFLLWLLIMEPIFGIQL